MPTAARVLAQRILLEVSGRGPTLGDRLARADVEALAPRDRAFLHELVLGTLRRRGALDHAIAAATDRPLDAIDPGVLAALRLGAHQVLHLRVPDRAAVSESVELARGANPRAAGFANAVLRRLAREGPPAAPDPARDPLGWLTTAGSLPAWLATRWLERLGPAAAVARAEAFREPPRDALRLHPRRDGEREAAARGVELRPTFVPGALEVRGGPAGELAGAGLATLQDLGSQAVARIAAEGARPGRALDACAAPGGKTLVLADAWPDARLVAADASARRLAVVARRVRDWGAASARLVVADARHPPFAPGSFDLVLLDAPCSGLGTLSRNPDIRWRLAADDILRQAGRQRALVEATSVLVAPGGTLVYSVCSTEPEEARDPVTDFLAVHPDFAPGPLPAWAEPFAEGPWFASLPERDRVDGFRAVRLVRRGPRGL